MVKPMDDPMTRDLINLAMDRIEKDVASVTQLADDDRVKFSILASVAANVINDATAIMVENVPTASGRKLTKEEAVQLLFKHILEALGIDWKASIRKSRK